MMIQLKPSAALSCEERRIDPKCLVPNHTPLYSRRASPVKQLARGFLKLSTLEICL